jgi:hypothetical protein
VLLDDLLDGQTTGVVGGLRMVGDTEILETALARGLGHGLQRLCAVGSICVAVQDSAKVLVGDQLRQFAVQSQFDFTAPLPEFRIDEGQTEGTIDTPPRRRSGTPLLQAVCLQPKSLPRGQRL